MKKILSIFSICLLLVSCATPQRGSGIIGKINITQPDPNKANLYIKYSSTAHAYGFAPYVVIENNNVNQNITLGDDESSVIKVDGGLIKIIVYPPLDKISKVVVNPYFRTGDPFGIKQERQKILTKEKVSKGNNYFFVIRPELNHPFSEYLMGKSITINYGIYETNQSSFLDFQHHQHSFAFNPNKVPNIHGFTEDIFDRETLLQIAAAEKEFENKETAKITLTIKKAEADCLKKGIAQGSPNFNECTFETWKNVYGKQYMDYKKDTAIEYKLIERQVYAYGDKNLQSMFDSGQNSLEMSDATSDIIKFAITIAASYYLGKAIGSAIKQQPAAASSRTSNVAQVTPSRKSGLAYMCFVNYGGNACLSEKGYAPILR
jgi:hypothetical protein